MMTDPTCPTCGAPLPMAGSPCVYCQGVAGAMSIGGLAQAVAVNERLLADRLPQLVEQLSGALPGRVHVERGGLLHGGHIDLVDIDLDTRRFTLELRHGRVQATVGDQNRGVVLRHDEVAAATWFAALEAAIFAHAAGQASVGPGINRLLGRS
ncbi:MAG: hypothetical protein ACR2GX_08850 [Candidatus Dormibacteria bacterium]